MLIDSTGSLQVPTPKNPKRDPLHGQKTLKVTGFLEEFEKDDIKKNVDIVELFASFGVKLEKKGKNFMGLCPWHTDKSPSLSVDREKGLYNCFGCGEAGDAFDLVEKMKGFDFKESLKFLKDWKGHGQEVQKQAGAKEGERRASPLKPLALPVQREIKPVEKKPSTESETVHNLNTVKNYYHKRLFDHSEALEYLQKRGFKTPGLYERFQVGFADGHLNLVIGSKQQQALTEAGILNPSTGSGQAGFREHFLNCLIFPIFDEVGNTLSFYGRDISDTSTFKHRYLKGEHRGIFNRKASKVYDEVVLTECIIDALSLIETGLENVQAIYGTNGFTDEHLETLKADRVKTVILALDNDEAGQKATEKLKERFISEGFKVKIISPYSGKDWNEALTSGKLVKEDLKTLIEQTAIFEKVEELKEGFKVREEKGQYFFIYPDISYRLTGVKEMFVNSLKVTVKAESNNDYFIDTVDFYLYRSRTNFAAHLSSQFGMELKRIEKDLLSILEHLEKQKEEKLRADEPKKTEISEEDRRTGLEFLKSPALFQEIVQDMNVMGYVGEDLNKQLLYLCASSRVLDDPISILILSESASGKSFLVDTVKKLIPPEDVISVTSLSDQALNYIKDLMHKFLVLGEAVHSDEIEHSIREMLSGHELSRLVTVKDEKTGKMESTIVRKPVVTASVMSSTVHGVNPENASRCFVINTDESREQTRRIHESQRQKYSLERYHEKEKVIPEIVKKHHAAQRLLRKLLIVNPFGKFLNFPDNQMRTRRDNDRFLDLIACVCFLRQYQKTVKWEGLTEFIECDLEDYGIAFEIMVKSVLTSTMRELPKSALELYKALREMASKAAVKSGIKPNESSFTQREIRETTDYGQSWIKQNLRILVDFEYIVLVRGGGVRSKGVYRIREDEEIGKLNLSAIPTPDEIAIKMKTGQTGQNWALTSLTGLTVEEEKN